MTDTTSAPTVTDGIAVPLAQFFRAELATAKQLGYGVQGLITGTAAVVRLIPKTQKAKRIATQTAAPGTTAPAIEAVQVYDMPQHRLEAVQSALNTALATARDAAA